MLDHTALVQTAVAGLLVLLLVVGLGSFMVALGASKLGRRR